MQFLFKNDPDGNRTRVTAVKGRCLNRLTTGPSYEHFRGAKLLPLPLCSVPFYIYLYKKRAPRVGLEPTTLRLTAECSTIELSRIILYLQNFIQISDSI